MGGVPGCGRSDDDHGRYRPDGDAGESCHERGPRQWARGDRTAQDELQDVLKALRHAKINVVAIHNHMTHEPPRIMFLHFWATGPAEDLVRGIKAALDTQKR